jgi:hypothetical protein
VPSLDHNCIVYIKPVAAKSNNRSKKKEVVQAAKEVTPTIAITAAIQMKRFYCCHIYLRQTVTSYLESIVNFI